METLAYNPFSVTSFLPNCQHTTYKPTAFNPPTPTLFEFSTTPPSLSQETSISSPVADISNTLNGITVSSPQESPKRSPSPPISPRILLKPNRVRRNLSLSMDTIVKSPSDSCIPSSLATNRLIRDDVLVVPAPATATAATSRLSPIFPSNSGEEDDENESPCKSPKRTREEREKDDAEILEYPTASALPQPRIPSPSFPILPRSASTNFLGKEGKQRARSLLMKSESFVRKDPSVSCILPTMYGPHPDLQYLSPETVADVIDGKFNDKIDEFHIIDCRFPYEYDGGHIKTAVNLTENEIKQMFIDNPRAGKRIAIIFHCEFSSQRAPRCLRFLRELDRKVNIAEYPKLTYPDVYVIDGGFKKFFETCENYCIGTYVEMRDERHFVEMKAHLKRYNFKRVRSMSADNSHIPFFQPIKLG